MVGWFLDPMMGQPWFVGCNHLANGLLRKPQWAWPKDQNLLELQHWRWTLLFQYFLRHVIWKTTADLGSGSWKRHMYIHIQSWYIYIYNMCIIPVSLSTYRYAQSSLPTPCHWDRSLLLFVGLWKSRSSERTMTAYLTSCYTAMLVWFLVHALDPGSSRMETVFQAHSWVLTSDMTGQSLNDLAGPRCSKADCMWFTGTGKFLVIPDTAGPGNDMEGNMSLTTKMQEYQWFNWAQVQPSHGWYQYLSIWYCGFIICLEWKPERLPKFIDARIRCWRHLEPRWQWIRWSLRAEVFSD